ncbi:hypothetical protein A5844_002184 [Enterococcus sp. 10A9_DIV0425]|uniref:WxL domain-containing protein n=1 Tax=Candidatus Enterococcus wittei TaxID=1987383 RepID=A0A242JYT1_9ENTE|nr:WxL domain-containing protein [Enterococcus sp. 10A9_DIV0425]OTP10484.1 hypothetical protein A5844_002184 [Enterococcus sp. 10A9_DIV0425]THE12897.1 hypothetical protein E1H99_06775 [Enterococcus hirae]
MKKIFASVLSTTLLSTTILGGGAVFAATSDTQGETPVNAKLTLPTDKDVVPPTVTNPDPNDPAVVPPTVPAPQPQGRGIVYYPGTQSVTAELQENGEQNIKLQSKIHVGVKDKLRQQDAWNLTATLEWTGANAAKFNGVTIKGENGTVQENDGNGNLSAIANGEVTTSATDLTISETATSIMETTTATMKNGTYDYSVDNFKINIPEASVVPADDYTGTINWDLAVAP